MDFRLPAFLLVFALFSAAALADCGDPVALKKTTTENHDAGIMVSGDTVILRPHANGWNALMLRQVVGSELEVCLTVISRIDEDPRSSAGGLQFWRSGQSVDDDFYAVLVDSGGNASVARLESGTWHDIVKWGRSKLLRKGLNARNELRLTTSGDTARLFFNGKLFKTVQRRPGGKGGYGTAVMAEASKAAAQFDFTNVRSSTQTSETSTLDPPKSVTPVVPSDPAPDTGPPHGADPVAPAAVLDAEGKRIYDLLLAVPPLSDNVDFIKTKFIKATGNLSPEKDSGHGIAEVTYSFDPPAGGSVNRMTFYIYPDAAEAKKYIPNRDSPFTMLRDNPGGSFHHDRYDPEEPFETQIDYFSGIQAAERVAWTRWINQSDRVVMVGFTDETLPPLKKKGTTTDRVSDETLDRGLHLLQIAKLHLNGIREMKISTETSPASGGTLDAGAKRVFDDLASSTPDAEALQELGTSFLGATSSLSPKPAHGLAEVVYQLKPPADGVETSLSFFLYRDAAAAARYLNIVEGYEVSVLADVPDGQMGHGTVDPFGPFDTPLMFMDGGVKGERRGWGRVIYQEGPVVIVALVGEKVSDEAGYKISDQALRQGTRLVALGKKMLDAAETPAGGASPTPKAP